MACPAICRVPAVKPENAVCLVFRGAWIGAASQPIVGKPDSYALRAETGVAADSQGESRVERVKLKSYAKKYPPKRA